LESSLSVVIVAWNSASDLARTLPALAGELGPDDEVILVDNDSADDPAGVARRWLPMVRVVSMNRNAGYAAAVNRGAAEAGGDLLVLLNPDARPEPGFREAICRPFSDDSGWAAWMALVVYDHDGRRQVNSAGNPLHFTGFSWAGDHGRGLPGPGASLAGAALSGACLATPLETWRRSGGFAGRFFLYHEDTDLSIRLLLSGGRLGLAADAVVDHDYDFASSPRKYFWLERNRLAMIARNYPASLLLLLLPALVLTEAALLIVAGRGGWLRAKLDADAAVLRWMPRLLLERRRIQASRTVGPGEFASNLTADLDSPFFPAFVRRNPVRAAMRLYWRLVLALLG
jgi:GT2 family glycosyltransferase